MKKLIVSMLLIFLGAPVFSQAVTQAPRTFHIHSEKRPFIKKGDRKKMKHRHHIKHKMKGGKHLREKHIK